MQDQDLRDLPGRVLRLLVAGVVGVTATRVVAASLWGDGFLHEFVRRHAPQTNTGDGGQGLIALWLGGFAALASYLLLGWWSRRRARADLALPRALLRGPNTRPKAPTDEKLSPLVR
jgi:Zn-dependent protease with chaperone function